MKILKNGCLDVTEIVIDKQSNHLAFTTELASDSVFIAKIEYAGISRIQQLVLTQEKDGICTFKLPFEVTKDLFDAPDITLKLECLIGTGRVNSEPVPIKIDHKKLASACLTQKQPELMELYLKVGELEKLFKQYSKGFVNPTLKPFDKTLTKKGMVYMIIDDQGNAAFTEEFLSFIKSVNGVRTVDGRVTIGAQQILCEDGRSIEEQFAAIRAEMKEGFTIIRDALTTIITTQGEMLERIKKLEMDKVDEQSAVI